MKQTVAIIGGGPAAMICAAFLNKYKFKVTIYEKNKTLGRKFLVAGKGGFNLTHSEGLKEIIDRYTPSFFLQESLSVFHNNDLRDWLDSIGINTYIGSSRRVYPMEGIKPIEVLRAILEQIKSNDVKIVYDSEWRGWSNNDLVLETGNKPDHVVFGLGGGSWKVTGSAGDWLSHFETKGIKTAPFYSSNCGYEINWPFVFTLKHGGKPLKNISIRCADISQKGEAVITDFGLEGNAIYALSPVVREQLRSKGNAIIFIDCKPMLSLDQIIVKINKSRFSKTSDILKKDLKISPVLIDLLKSTMSKEAFLDTNILTSKIKNLSLEIVGIASLDESISSVGGVSLEEVDSNFELIKLPNHYCIGEMLDWDAPTGGYLLQACFSMGYKLAMHLNSEVTE